MEPHRYNLLHALIWSFFSRGFYHDVARRWRGIGFWYLFILLGLTWMMFTLQLRAGLVEFLEGPAKKVLDQVPAITIADGVVSCDEQQPFYIMDPDTKKPIAALDTTGELTSLDGHDDLLILLTQSKVYVRKSSHEIQTHDLSTMKGTYSADGTKLQRWARFGPVLVFPVGWGAVWALSLTYRLMLALVLGAVGLGFASLWGRMLTYGAAVRLAVFAMSPIIVLDTLIGVAGLRGIVGCMWLPVSVVVIVGYVAFAVSSVDHPSVAASLDDDLMPPPPDQGTMPRDPA